MCNSTLSIRQLYSQPAQTHIKTTSCILFALSVTLLALGVFFLLSDFFRYCNAASSIAFTTTSISTGQPETTRFPKAIFVINQPATVTTPLSSAASSISSYTTDIQSLTMSGTLSTISSPVIRTTTGITNTTNYSFPIVQAIHPAYNPIQQYASATISANCCPTIYLPLVMSAFLLTIAIGIVFALIDSYKKYIVLNQRQTTIHNRSYTTGRCLLPTIILILTSIFVIILVYNYIKCLTQTMWTSTLIGISLIIVSMILLSIICVWLLTATNSKHQTPSTLHHEQPILYKTRIDHENIMCTDV